MNPTTLEMLMQVFAQGLAVTASVAVILSPVLVPMLPGLVGAVRSKIKGTKSQAAFDAVSRAGLLAATAYEAELEKALAEARSPASPGGVLVTKEERQAALARAVVGAGWGAIVKEGLAPAVSAYYGSPEDAMRAIKLKARRKVEGPPGGRVGAGRE